MTIDFGLRSRDYALHRHGPPARWYERLASFAPIEGSRVLDLATGPGTVAFELARRGAFLLVVLLLLPVPVMAQAPSTPDEVIARVRAASNEALRAGDLDAFMSSIDVDYVGTAGNGGHIRDRAALQEMIGGLFAESPGHRFIRTPSEIEVDSSGRRAMEVGSWLEVPADQAPATSTGVRGRYTAYWRRVAARWVIHAEVFVTLGGG